MSLADAESEQPTTCSEGSDSRQASKESAADALPPRIPAHMMGGSRPSAGKREAPVPELGSAGDRRTQAWSEVGRPPRRPMSQPDRHLNAVELSNDLGKSSLDRRLPPKAPRERRRKLSRGARNEVAFSDIPPMNKRDVTEAERHQAATTIQRRARGYFVRLRIKHDKAATTIQRHAKGFVVRRKLRGWREAPAKTIGHAVNHQAFVVGLNSVAGVRLER